MTTNIPYNLVYEATNNNWLDSLCYWVKLRCNGIIYNYNSRNTGAILNLSPTTASRHIKILINKGLAEIRGKNLVIKTLKNTKTLKVKVYKKKRHQKLALMSLILGNNTRNQKKKIKQKLNLLNPNRRVPLTRQDKKLLSYCGGLAAIKRSFFQETMLSNSSIGKMLCRAKRTASRYQKEMNDLGVIKKTANFKKVGNFDLTTYMLHFKERSSKYIFFSGCVYIQLPNKIQVTSFGGIG